MVIISFLEKNICMLIKVFYSIQFLALLSGIGQHCNWFVFIGDMKKNLKIKLD